MKNKMVLKIDDSKITLDYTAFAPKSQFAETGVQSATLNVFPAGLEWALQVDSLNVANLLVKAGFVRFGQGRNVSQRVIRVPVSSLIFVHVSSRRARRKTLEEFRGGIKLEGKHKFVQPVLPGTESGVA